MTIPVQNIYYLLSYAWNRLEERDRVQVSAEDADSLPELFARVLVTGLNRLARRGLERGYVEKREELAVLRGQVCVTETVNRMGFRRGRLVCDYEELISDILVNQILKATLRRLVQAVGSSRLKSDLILILQRFHDVSDIRLEAAHFGRIVLHRNNRMYGFLLDICQFVWRNLLPNEESGRWEFRDFLRQRQQMGLLFEHFVRNFYTHHRAATGLSVDREYIRWRWEAADEESRAFLPQMETDVRLKSPSRKILIECKFALVTHANRYSAEKLISAHLYQLNAYLSNLPATEENEACEAILLYPAAGAEIKAAYRLLRRKISVRTVDLDQPWQDIEADMFQLIG